MKKVRISNIPVRLAMTIILIFGLIPMIGLSLYHYLYVSRTIAQGEKRQLEELRQELKMTVDSEISLLDSFMSMGKKRLQQSVKATSATVYDMLDRIYRQNETRLPRNEIAELIREYVRGIRLFNGRGYFFAYSLDGVLQVYPPDITQEGSNWLDIKDSNGKMPVREVIQLAKSIGEGYVEYSWPLPEKSAADRQKLTYIMYLKPLGWVIGIGDYLEESARQIQAYTIEVARQRNLGEGELFLFDRAMRQVAGQLKTGTGELPDEDLKNTLVDMKQKLRAGSGFRYSRPGKHGGARKFLIGYARYYEPWGWIIGRSVDYEMLRQRTREMRQQVKQDVIDDLLIMMMILLLAVFFVFLIGKIYAARLEKNLMEFESFFHKAGKSMEQIDLGQVRFHELKSLGELANTMVHKRETTQRAMQQINIKLKDTNRKLKEMASVDGLTQVSNRRFFDLSIEREWTRALRERQPVTLGMLDIDFFKLYNDTYGHQMGDECLISVASVLKEAARRPADLVARYGGEEFVILLVNTDLTGGKKVADRVRKRIAEMAIPHSKSPLGRVSFSMGLACMIPGKDETAATLVSQADKALYRAKAAGRDRIESAGV